MDTDDDAFFRTQKLACVEFDLSELPRDINYEQLRKMLEDNALPSWWVFNEKIEEENRRQAAERRREEAEERLRLRKLAALLRSKATSKIVYSTKNKAGSFQLGTPAGVRRSRWLPQVMLSQHGLRTKPKYGTICADNSSSGEVVI